MNASGPKFESTFEQEACWIDTHCHLDASEFDRDRDAVIAEARANGVRHIVIPAIEAANFRTVARLAHETPGAVYALGIHPLYTPRADKADIVALRGAIEDALDDERFVAIGEIGIDLFVPALASPEALAAQEWFFAEQIALAQRFDLPVLVHVRRSQDVLLKHLRRAVAGGWTAGGIAHAFNGSRQQADAFIALGFRLGFGGTMTYERSLRIRRLAAEVPENAVVLETDAPDIPPLWLHDGPGRNGRNAPHELPRIAESLAALRGWTLARTARVTARNARDVLPRLAKLASGMNDLHDSTPHARREV